MTAPRVERITSRSNPLLVRLRRLAADPGGYRKAGTIVLEGEHLCAAWLERRAGAEVPSQAIVTEAGWARPELRRLADAAARVAIVGDDAMRAVGSLESPAELAFIVAWPAVNALQPGQPALVLDGVQDPGNAGTLLRSAAAFGFMQAIALAGTVALWSPKVLRAGMGAHFALTIVEGAAIESLDALGLPLLGTSSHAERAIDDVRLPWPCAWAFGNEGRGISAALQARCELVLRIAQPGGQESLNVAAAAAVCLYESSRQRRPG